MHTDRQPESTGAWAVYSQIDLELAKKFAYWTRFDEHVELCKVGPNGKMLLPRAAAPLGKVDERVVGTPIKITSNVKPRNSEQASVIESTSQLLAHGHSFIVQAPTGFGKTVCAAAVIASVARKTLVIVPKEDLMEQWRQELLMFTDLKPEDIGIIRGPKCSVDGKKVVLGMLKSLSKPEKYPSSIRHAFGLVIWDEVHRLPAATFQTTAGYFYAKLRLGLSATPERSDGKEATVYAHIGPVMVETELMTLEPIVGLYRSNWQVPRYGGSGKYMAHSAGKTMHVEKTFIDHEDRNRLLVSLIGQAWQKNRKTVVFSSLIQHLRLLQEKVHEKGVPPKDTGLYISETPVKEREKIKSRPIIFATYGMMKEGTNIPWLDTCVLATPMSNIKQAVGRILREYPDKPRPVILDIVDDHSPVFKRYAQRRLDCYMDLKADIHEY